jgi:hypothetical protein
VNGQEDVGSCLDQSHRSRDCLAKLEIAGAKCAARPEFK